MGQRHQLFAVAKIASRYRVLAAIHHQWLYGEAAVARALQILKLFQANAPLLRQDLQYANQVDWQSIKPRPDRTMAERRAMTSEERAQEREAELANVSRPSQSEVSIVLLSFAEKRYNREPSRTSQTCSIRALD